LSRDKLEAAFLDGLPAATNGGWALGDERFKRHVAKSAGRRALSERPPAQEEKGQAADKTVKCSRWI